MWAYRRWAPEKKWPRYFGVLSKYDEKPIYVHTPTLRKTYDNYCSRLPTVEKGWGGARLTAVTVRVVIVVVSFGNERKKITARLEIHTHTHCVSYPKVSDSQRSSTVSSSRFHSVRTFQPKFSHLVHFECSEYSKPVQVEISVLFRNAFTSSFVYLSVSRHFVERVCDRP